MDPTVDEAEALNRVGGDRELLGELATLFLGECPRQLAGIRAALGGKDYRKLQIAAHTLKGSVATFGARAAEKSALQLEALGRSEHLAGAAELLAELERALDQLRPVLAGWAENGESKP